jgi:hypothetical protein
MKSPGLTVFILFFGLSLVEALWSGNWITAGLWLAAGITFWALDARVWSRPAGRARLER